MPRTWVLNKLPLSFAGHLSIYCRLPGMLQALLLALAWDPPSASQCLPLPVSPTVSRKMQTFCAQHRHVHQSATRRLEHHLGGWFQTLAARAQAVNGTVDQLPALPSASERRSLRLGSCSGQGVGKDRALAPCLCLCGAMNASSSSLTSSPVA